MARSDIRTWLPLDEFAQIIGLDPLGFNGLHSPTLQRNTVCGDVFFQQDWQHSDRLGRDTIAMPYLIPPVYISALAVLCQVLCLFSFRKIERMTRSSLVEMFRLGIVLIGSSMFLIGVLYFYYSTGEIEIHLRSATLRWALSYLLVSINVWQIILLRFGKNL